MDKRISTIIFDLDGVIVDSEPLHFEAHKKALEKFGVELLLEDYMDFGVAQGDGNLYEKASRKFNVDIDKKEISKLKKQIYRDIFNEKAKLRVGILDLIKSLYGEYDLAVASSGVRDTVEYVIEKFELKKYFREVVTGDDVDRVKPFPDIYNKTVQMLGVDKNECIAIEDSTVGVTAAKEAGIRCLAVPCEFTKNQDFSRADMVLEDIEQIIGAIV